MRNLLILAVLAGCSPTGALIDEPLDTDGDGIPDYLDLDDDNDGIPDTIEAPTGEELRSCPERWPTAGRRQARAE